MNIVSETKAALQLAKKAHEGQLRAIGPDMGLPYFDTHVLRVVRSSPEWARPAAALHDVLEDTDTTIEDLEAAEWLSFDQLQAVLLLTRDPTHTYHQYIVALADEPGAAGRIARAVKLADLMDNLSTLPEGSLRKRYLKALHIIAEVAERDEQERGVKALHIIAEVAERDEQERGDA